MFDPRAPRTVPDQMRKRFSSYSELEQAAAHIRALVESPGWALVSGIAMERHEKAAASLDGAIHPLERYVANHCERTGIRQVLDIPEAVLKAYQVEDEKQRRAAERLTAEQGGDGA